MTTAETTQPELLRTLLDAGLHFGHQTKRWNPKMKPYVFSKQNGIHIIDLIKTIEQLGKAREFVRDIVSAGKQILFVGTKKPAQEIIKDVATRCNMPYVTSRWLGGTLTNNLTIRKRVKRLRDLQKLDTSGEFEHMHKKEVSQLRHELKKLEFNLSGLADMDKLPGALFVVDVNREAIAVAEAKRLDIPVIAIVDTNCDPSPISVAIPGNDDAMRGIKVILEQLATDIEQALGSFSNIAAEALRKREQDRVTAEASAKAVAQERKAARVDAIRKTSNVERKPEVKPAAKLETIAEDKPVAAPEVMAEAKPEDKADAKPAAKPRKPRVAKSAVETTRNAETPAESPVSDQA
ncbi:MAG: 30S ribosomal protein S2 [bacterium]